MSDKTALVTALILDRPMCLPCTALKGGMSPKEAEETLQRIATVVGLHRVLGRCRDCGITTSVTSIERPAGPAGLPGPPGRRPTSHAAALWQFFESHRGDLFCTRCLSIALETTGRFDRAIISAEGRGAIRRYGPCSRCGMERLLCGLAA
jgi:hypothetical protein